MNEQLTEQGLDESSEVGLAKVIYILYLAGLIFGVSGIVGVIMAYISKANAPMWAKTHYQFQIRTFWIGFLYLFLAAILSVVIIGYFIALFWVV